MNEAKKESSVRETSTESRLKCNTRRGKRHKKESRRVTAGSRKQEASRMEGQRVYQQFYAARGRSYLEVLHG
jgi:hypothetical protein